MRLPRSYLYVPGNASDKLAKAAARGADALIIDLEDAVPPAAKSEAAAAVVAWLRDAPAGGPQLWVRVNEDPLRQTDVATLANLPTLTGLVLAKVRDASEVAEIAAQLDACGDRNTLLMPLLETSSAVLEARSLAAQPRVHQLQVGEVDLCADAGITPGPDDAELGWVRGMVVLASAATGVHPPVGPVSRLIQQTEALAESTRAVRRQGFFGRACIHPAQLPVVHDVFTPSEQEVTEAREVLEAFDRATAAGSGVAVDSAGRMIDMAVVRGARVTVAAAENVG
jgi:citrate lyase subunit beta / citryl-CoA lyase